MTNWYDTKEGLEEHITSLDKLRILFQVRHEAGYVQKEWLDKWCVLGRWILDPCGNCSWISEGAPKDTIPNIVRYKDLFSYLPKDASITSLFTDKLPVGACKGCGEVWTLAEVDDHHSVSNESWHKRCWLQHRHDISRKEFEDVFVKAGFKGLFFQPIPNEYWGNAPFFPDPWWLVETSLGIIQIGWRKRVIQISWEFSSDVDFSDEDVTQNRNYIHAWGFEKATEYLSRLRNSQVKGV